MSTRSSGAQHDLIRRLMREAGTYDLATVTAMHANLGATERWQGKTVDEWLDTRSKDEASQIIRVLQQEVA